MSHSIPVDVFRKELLDLLDETFENTQGIYLDRNTSLFETLEGLSADQASKSISPKGATIAGSWRVAEVEGAEWTATIARLRTSYQRTLDVVNGLEEWEGENDIGASLAILAHTASHLGAIRQALHIVN